MLANKYTLTVHSLVDLITNSSTQVYVEASESSIKALRELINNILKLGGSTKTCDDLFTIELNPDDVKQYLPEEEGGSDWDNNGYKNISLLVKSRDTNSPEGKAAEKVLSSLDNLFCIEACYDS